MGCLFRSLQVLWENRLEDDIQNDCLVSVDGTDFRIQQLMPFWKGWYSHKFKGPGLRYEVGVCIRSGNIVWLHGPFPCGEWPDIKIFRHALIDQLSEGERVEADDGYVGESPRHIKIPDALDSKEKNRMRATVRMRHETVNRRFKQFGALKQTFRHDLIFQSAFVRAVVVITQLAFQNGEPVFDVDYDDRIP